MTLNILDMRLSVLRELPKDKIKDMPVESFILDSIQEMCKESYCYTEAITLTSVKDQAIYPMTITTSNAEVIGFWQGKYNNVTLENISNKDMDSKDKRWETRTGTPDGIIYDGDTNVRFNITPDTSGKAIQLEPVIQPSNINGVVPPRIERRHQQAVKSYVKWKFFEKPGENFNAELAIYYRRDYERKKDKLKIEVAFDNTNSVEVRPRSFVYGRTTPPYGLSLNE